MPQPIAASASDAATPSAYLEAGTPEYRRANIAMFIGGFATFALVYCTQPLLPLLASEFGVSAASASLSVSATTAGLALMLSPGSVLADRLGRQQLMKLALAIAAVLALATAFAPDFLSLLVLRVLYTVFNKPVRDSNDGAGRAARASVVTAQKMLF